MRRHYRFYVDGRWIEPSTARTAIVIDPATETSVGDLSLAAPEDVDRAVRAARLAFETYSRTSRNERLALLRRILSEYERRYAEVAAAIIANINDAPVKSNERKYHWPLGRRPDDHPSLSDLGLR